MARHESYPDWLEPVPDQRNPVDAWWDPLPDDEAGLLLNRIKNQRIIADTDRAIAEQSAERIARLVAFILIASIALVLGTIAFVVEYQASPAGVLLPAQPATALAKGDRQ